MADAKFSFEFVFLLLEFTSRKISLSMYSVGKSVNSMFVAEWQLNFCFEKLKINFDCKITAILSEGIKLYIYLTDNLIIEDVRKQATFLRYFFQISSAAYG